MRKLILAAVVAFAFVIVSCNDIVDSENNINKTKQVYNSVKSDQVHGVILPLKVGNKYIYNVTEYYSTGETASVSKDSIVVNSEVLINGERWFLVHFPMLNYETDVYLTNTDLGLWFKCDICNKESYLIAHYPMVNSKMTNGVFKFSALLNNGNSFTDTCQRYINSSVESGKVLNYNNSLSYQHVLQLYNNKREFVSYDCNFVENVGLIRFRQNWLDLMESNSQPMLERLYELERIDSSDGNVIQSTFTIDFGDIKAGNIKDTSVIVLNNLSAESIIIENIMTDDNSGIFTIQALLPITVPPNALIESVFSCRPVSVGKFQTIMHIVTNKETFDVTLKCNATK